MNHQITFQTWIVIVQVWFNFILYDIQLTQIKTNKKIITKTRISYNIPASSKFWCPTGCWRLSMGFQSQYTHNHSYPPTGITNIFQHIPRPRAQILSWDFFGTGITWKFRILRGLLPRKLTYPLEDHFPSEMVPVQVTFLPFRGVIWVLIYFNPTDIPEFSAKTEVSAYAMVTGCSKFKRWKMEFFAASRDQKRWKFLHVLLMEEILHHLGCKKSL